MLKELVLRMVRVEWPRFRLGWKSPVSRLGAKCDVVVSMTTHGQRIFTVHAAIFSILRGSVVPKRFFLILNDLPNDQKMLRLLEDLKGHGVEIVLAPNYGPHTKYFPLVSSPSFDEEALVTADDDIFYPRNWLKDLVEAHGRFPDDVVCWWAKKMTFHDERLESYNLWPNVTDTEARSTNFALGVGGVLYSKVMLQALRTNGPAFQGCCPRADDIWLHATALRSGLKVRQITSNFRWPRHIPNTQEVGLKNTNHLADGNDKQIVATYLPEEIRQLFLEHQAAQGV